MKKVFLEHLPKRIYKGKECINWIESRNYKVHFIYGDIESDILIEDYIGSYLYVSYNNIKNFKIYSSAFARCQLGKLLEKRTGKFKIEIGTKFKDNKRDITIIDRKYKNKIKKFKNKKDYIQKEKWYRYHCNACGYDEGWIIESNLIKGVGCSCCGGITVAEGINNISTISPWMVKYFQGGYNEAKLYTSQSGKEIYPVCPDCGQVKDKKMSIYKIYQQNSIGCRCGDGFSYGHKYIFNILTQLNLNFIDNHTFDWCKFYNTYKQKSVLGEYDFVLENINLIIEVDGGFHRKDNTMNGQTAEESKFLDNEKDRLAKENGYSVIRISDEGDIKQNILNSDLFNIFNILKIDWINCEIFACRNLVKVACNYKKNNTDMTTTQIGEIMGISSSVVCTYLKKGVKFNWCCYNSEKEIIKSHDTLAKYIEQHSKPIKMFDNKLNLVYMFYKIKECELQSEKLFGTKLNSSHISSICLNKRKLHKGYTFQYTTKEEYKQWVEQQNKLLIHNENLGQAI